MKCEKNPRKVQSYVLKMLVKDIKGYSQEIISKTDHNFASVLKIKMSTKGTPTIIGGGKKMRLSNYWR